MENHSPNHQPAENMIASAVTRVKQTAEEKIHRLEHCTRESPLPSLAAAVVVGYVLRGLPVRSLAGLVVRVALMFVRPLIFIIGAAKIYELVREEIPARRSGPASHE